MTKQEKDDFKVGDRVVLSWYVTAGAGKIVRIRSDENDVPLFDVRLEEDNSLWVARKFELVRYDA